MSAADAPSWLESSARDRLAALLDPGSFTEFTGPEQRVTSPHLAAFDLPCAFDDGVVVGRGRLDGRLVFAAAQEGRFMGGTFGEVSGAKIVGLLRAATAAATSAEPDPATAPRAVLLLLDTGGVRLQEANAGELAVSETLRAIAAAKRAGLPVIALVGGRAGAFGGGGLTGSACSALAISRLGRTGVTGPEVIETNQGVEEFDSADRALVWRITGGRTRALSGAADRYCDDTAASFREAAIALSGQPAPFDLAALQAEHARLRERLDRAADSRDAPALWARLGIDDPDTVADRPEPAFAALLASRRPNAPP